MLRLNPRQREALGETFREMANYGIAALVFGQFVGSQMFSWSVVLSGIALWLVLVSYALSLEGD